MRSPLRRLVLVGMAFVTFLPATQAMFEAFVQLAEQLRQIEQSAPADQGKTVEKLQTVSFTDVAKAEWYYRYVIPIASWNIASGYKNEQGKPTGTFGPGNTVTTAEILKMALKAAQVDETTCTGKATEDHWAKPFLACAREKKMRLFRGTTDLNRPATRAEVLSVIFDAFGDKIPPLFAPFKDTEGHSLEPDIAYGAALKMVSGDKDATGKPTGTFRPDDPVTRSEAAKIIYERLRVRVMEKK